MVRRILRTAGRTALVAGTATAVAGRVAHRQRQKLAKTYAPQPETSLAPKSARTHNDIAESLQALANLNASGALSDKEFKAAKAKLLS